MNRPALELADVVRRFAGAVSARYGSSLSWEQRRALRDIVACRTAALGGHESRCDTCGHREISYNSCRNRHCPKCQAAARAAWLAAREQELLPVSYFHVVFTLPPQFQELALQNPRVVYGLLFQAVSRTLLEVAGNPDRLGARIGFLCFLHTWGQNLTHHPHLHCVVPGGGLSPNEERWITSGQGGPSGRKEFFLPVRVLSRVFRGKFLAGLKALYRAGKLKFFGSMLPRAQPAEFEGLLDASVRKDWVVYAKRPFGGPKQVLRYLARYTHRVAISNQRLIDVTDRHVSFQYKDYADGSRSKVMVLEGSEFLRRFLMHVLPRGFVRIRHYGFLANRQRGERLDLCRRLLSVSETNCNEQAPSPASPGDTADAEIARVCPGCRTGKLVFVELVPPMSKGEVLVPFQHHALTAVETGFGHPVGELHASTRTRIDSS